MAERGPQSPFGESSLQITQSGASTPPAQEQSLGLSTFGGGSPQLSKVLKCKEKGCLGSRCAPGVQITGPPNMWPHKHVPIQRRTNIRAQAPPAHMDTAVVHAVAAITPTGASTGPTRLRCTGHPHSHRVTATQAVSRTPGTPQEPLFRIPAHCPFRDTGVLQPGQGP